MPTPNTEIATILDRYGALLEITGANPFRVRAYHNAARVINALPQSVEGMLAEGKDLTELPSIGQDLAAKVAEIVKTGSFSDYRALQHKLPAGLMDLETISGLGSKRVKQLYEQLGISDVPSLMRACKAGKVSELKGFGKTSEEKLLAACAQFHPGEKRFKLAEAEQIAEPLLAYLRGAPGLKQVTIAGSYRRRKETVGDLDIVLACTRGTRTMNHFTAYMDVVEILSKGPTRATVRLRSGMQVDVRTVPEASYGAALLYFTGSKPHNIALRTIAAGRGLKINEYGVFKIKGKGKKSIAGRTEQEIYRLLDLPYIEPELRENRGEIEAARAGRLPQKVTLKDIRGDLHAHTDATDGTSTLEEMAEAARALGYEYLAITEHTRHAVIARGLDAKGILKRCEAIERLNTTLKGIRLLKSAEVDILEDGTLDLPDNVLKQLDLVVCAVHSGFDLPAEKQTERIIRALDNPYVNILAHPSGRLIGERPGYACNMEKIMYAAKERGCFLELNAFPDRLDLDDIHCRMARDMELKVAISTDAHHTSHLGYMRFGISQARRGWLEKTDVINTHGLAELLKLLKR